MTLGDSRTNRREHDIHNEENGDSPMDQGDESEGSYYDGEEEEEDYFLQRLSEQARQRGRCNSNMNEDMDDESYDGENAIYSDADNEDLEQSSFSHEGELDPVNFLRRLIQARARTANHDNSNTDYADEGATSNIFLANRGSGRDSHDSRDEESDDDNDNGDPPSRDFADVFTRIIRGGTLFGGQDRESGEIWRLINSLNQREDISLILESLNELSERLLMMNGITAEKLIPAGKLAKSLVEIMQDPLLIEEFEVNLVACRCLYNFLEVNQDFIHEALNYNAIECLCGKLLEVACIDLTEQALQTLEMISRDPISHNSIIAASGLKACLQYLDFLTVHAQRKCLSIVANSCTNASPNNIEMIKDVFGDIFTVAKYHHDSVVVENCWLAISRVVMCLKLRPDYLKELFFNKVSISKEMAEVIYISYAKSPTSYNHDEASKIALNHSSCLSLLKSLIILSSVSVEISRVLIEECFVGKIITMTLMKLSKPETSKPTNAKFRSGHTQKNVFSDTAIETFMTTPKELVSHFLDLIGYLLPIAYNMNKSPFLDDSFEDHPERVQINGDRLTLYKHDITNSFLQFVSDIWHLLINGYQATMEYNLRKKLLINIFRVISFYDQDELKKINGIKQITNLLIIIVNQGKAFISKCGAKDLKEEIDMTQESFTEQSRGTFKDDSNTLRHNTLLLGSFLIIQSLMEKAPTLFIEDFVKEGLINDIIEIFNRLKASNNIGRANKFTPRSNHCPSYRINKYIDFELSSVSDCCLSEERVTCSLLKSADSIKELCSELSSSGKVETGNDLIDELEKIRLLLCDVESTRSFNLESWTKTWERLRNVLLSTDEKAQISSFELASSGILECLTNTLQFESFELGSQLHNCHEAFLLVFFGNNIAESSESPPINIFIEKLQEILNRSEFFEIISSGGNIQGYGSSNTSVMARQVKLKLTPVGDIKKQFQTRDIVLSVHAIATFKSIEGFIKHKVRFLDMNRVFQEVDDVESEEGNDVNIEFFNKDEIIPLETTVYGAIYRSLQDRDDETVKPNVIFSNVHEISFRKTERKNLQDARDKKPTTLKVEDNDLSYYDTKTLNILRLLKVLFELNFSASDTLRNTKGIANDCFINLKMTVKLSRQLEDLLVVASGTLPGWCIQIPKHFPFIFPLATRLFLLQSTSFGYSRLIHHWQMRNNQGNDENNVPWEEQSLGRPTRHKVRISRRLILQSAVKVLGLYGSSPGILEVEYFDEVGSGLGPTLEFYASVSKEFTKKRLKLWRDYDADCRNEQDYISASTGCFPLPLDRKQIHGENGRKVLFLFNSLGKFIARAMLDSRILDFNFNPAFLILIQIFNRQKCYKLSKRNLKKVASISTLKLVDPDLANSLEHLMKYADQFSYTCEEQRPHIKVDGCTLDELCLYFVLPGYPEYELIPQGQNILITDQNLLFYIHSILDATLYSGVIHQIKSFMEGFSTVFPISTLLLFSPDELVELFGNAEEDWSVDVLHSSVNTNHGYSKDSSSLKQLISIFSEFDYHQRRFLLQFITGSPRLPPGGFKALRPPFTVVRKLPENGLTDDDYLPSVMSCANYLKLPKYSSKEIMKKRILQAITEGSGSFLLS